MIREIQAGQITAAVRELSISTSPVGIGLVGGDGAGRSGSRCAAAGCWPITGKRPAGGRPAYLPDTGITVVFLAIELDMLSPAMIE